MKNNKIKGQRGEAIASKFLKDKGYEILHTNYYASRHGEIDIIAKKGSTLIFCEVKTRTTNNFGHPLESITPSKLQKMYKSINFYFSENNPATKNYRIDAISVILKPELEILHIENISV